MEGGGVYMKVAATFKGNNYLVWSRMARNAVGSVGVKNGYLEIYG